MFLHMLITKRLTYIKASQITRVKIALEYIAQLLFYPATPAEFYLEPLDRKLPGHNTNNNGVYYIALYRSAVESLILIGQKVLLFYWCCCLKPLWRTWWEKLVRFRRCSATLNECWLECTTCHSVILFKSWNWRQIAVVKKTETLFTGFTVLGK